MGLSLPALASLAGLGQGAGRRLLARAAFGLVHVAIQRRGFELLAPARDELRAVELTRVKSGRKELVARYTPTRTNPLSAALTVADGEANLTIHELTDLGAARECVLGALAVSIWPISQAMTQVRSPACGEFAFAAPAEAEAHGVPNLTLRYGQRGEPPAFGAHYLD